MFQFAPHTISTH